MMIVGFDFDGTLVESWTATPLPGVRERLVELPKDTKTFIATNQAGPVWREMTGETKYPTADDVADRIIVGLAALDWRPDYMLICVSSGQTEGGWFVAEANARTRLYDRLELHISPVLIEVKAVYRKPSPKMLQEAARFFGASRFDVLYIGDMLTDADAAMAASFRYLDAATWRERGLP